MNSVPIESRRAYGLGLGAPIEGNELMTIYLPEKYFWVSDSRRCVKCKRVHPLSLMLKNQLQPYSFNSKRKTPSK
uniref:Uncharacterized protein n=1 Tax=Lepeophtheirus salmonis TaxID=72036 RepID=A0A0K2VED9_LEPSM